MTAAKSPLCRAVFFGTAWARFEGSFHPVDSDQLSFEIKSLMQCT
ncbi:hypothetical protein HMPREF1989_02143 [Porphyromonas gingivalis F0566]|uniref:Uncharacterized protein n=1 Tax=Porphyromonas gingivalis F0570 TaxID=1227271 RepID=A0A0E2LNH4_PORGN|nr:hypothetical protein HMPREF1555_01888 [Porphyromonas gingivalis F0570]ERJ64315.1 hypothetical protein HMPREF1553_02382 [Porphyromonas gingivalis F0568]ERJ82387.1 hypothetical protein HMPREF1989_02143 [Porphyromonas gingivalis F0566]